ncbi:MAG TPA: outer membrane beta-barrel protein [Chryseolinea sp.]|nr:outer membrane beta-barrel protein [Chryseolinea sp.]
MKIRLLLSAIFTLSLTLGHAQVRPAASRQDTVVVALSPSSKVTLTIGDRADLETLKHYNFQALFQDIITKLEHRDTTALPGIAETEAPLETKPAPSSEDWNVTASPSTENDNDDDNHEDWNVHVNHRGFGRTWQSFNFELGTNNYLSNGSFPNNDNELYSVRPWGSWYVGLASIQRTRLSKKFFLEWGLGVNWYNFKFEEDNVLIQKDDNGTYFVADTRFPEYVKSKLTASYVTATLIPVIDFSDNSRKARIWEGYGNSFRFGLGPYVGYRIESHSKLVYKDDGKQKEKDHNSFYLNNVRYGLRLQMGYRAADFFFNYDLNDLFVEGKGPELNAFSFGVIF